MAEGLQQYSQQAVPRPAALVSWGWTEQLVSARHSSQSRGSATAQVGPPVSAPFPGGQAIQVAAAACIGVQRRPIPCVTVCIAEMCRLLPRRPVTAGWLRNS